MLCHALWSEITGSLCKRCGIWVFPRHFPGSLDVGYRLIMGISHFHAKLYGKAFLPLVTIA
jgi:hypothetical protein